jgi:protein-arginine kinase
MSAPVVNSKDSLVAKYLRNEIYEKYKNKKTATSGITLDDCIACAVKLDNQHVGIYAGDGECYTDYSDLFNPIIKEYHNFDGEHISDMNSNNIKGNINSNIPVISTRIRVGRNINGFGLSPGITNEHRLEVEKLLINAFKSFTGDLSGTYYSLKTMSETQRKQLVDDHFLFMSGDPNLKIAGMERDWPNGRGIFLNNNKTFLVWVNEEDQMRIISMKKGGDVLNVFKTLTNGIKKIEEYIKKNGKTFQFNKKLGYIHSCPTNLGTGMRASVHIDLGNLKKKYGGSKGLKDYCKTLKLQARGTRGESGGDTGTVYDISNRHRLGYTEVELVQTMIDGVNRLYKENEEAKN